MTAALDTQTQRFTFGNSWSSAVSSDEEPDLQAIKRGLGTVSTKDVDFLALRGPHALYMIEVKDFRGYSGDLEEKTNSGTLVKHVTQKVRDSIPAIVGAYRTSLQPDKWKPFAHALTQRNVDLYVVLWLEEGGPDGSSQMDAISKVGRDARQKELKQRLSWLTNNVLVEGRRSNAQVQLDIAVADKERTT